MSIAAANLFTRSIYCEFFRPRARAEEEARVGQWASLAVKLGAVGVLVLIRPEYTADLQSIGGVIILQTLPAVFFGLWSGWFHRWALVTGMLGGLGLSLYMLYLTPAIAADGKTITQAHFGSANFPLILAHINSPIVLYTGIVTLVFNMGIVIVGTALFKLVRVPSGVDLTRKSDYEADADDEALDRLDHLLDGGVAVSGAHALR
jgi:SSS family solute:Na+ symporter